MDNQYIYETNDDRAYVKYRRKEHGIDLPVISSSVIHSLEHNKKTNTLRVKFWYSYTVKEYVYEDIPSNIIDALFSATSPGSSFSYLVRNVYSYSIIEVNNGKEE